MKKLLGLLLICSFLLNIFVGANDKIKLQLQWKHQFEFAGFYAAKEKGFYKDVGLDVEFIEYTSGKNITDIVLKGDAQYGVTYASIISEYLNGKPLVLVASFFKQSPLVLIAQEHINTPVNLKGKIIEGVADTIDNITLTSMLHKFGIASNDIKHAPPTFNLDDFIDKKVDAMSVFTTNELFELNQKGIKYKIFDPTAYGIKYCDVNLFTTKNEVKNNPQRVKNFKEASMKGWEYALENKDEIIELILKKYNTQNKTKEALAFEAQQIEQIMLPSVYKIGSIDKFRIRMIAESFMQSGFIKDVKSIDIEKFIFNFKKNNQIMFTQEELKYIKQNPIIKVHNEMDWAPYNYNINGKATGYSIEYMKLLASKIGIKVDFISGYTWDQFLNLAKDNKIDVILNIAKTKQRETYLHYTTPFAKVVDAMVARKDNKDFNKLTDFEGKTLAIVDGFYEEEILKEYYPNIQLKIYDTSIEALKAVSFGIVDGTINSLGVVNYFIAEYGLLNIEPRFEIDDRRFNLNLHIATNKQNKILRDILEKAKQTLTAQEILKLNIQWLGMKNAKTTTNILNLTNKEKQFIQNTPKIVLGTGDTWKPYVIVNQFGYITGYDQDVINIINKISGLNIQLHPGNWGEMQKLAKAKTIDGLATGGRSEARKKYLNLSDIYNSLQKLIITTKENPKDIQSKKDLDGKTIAIHKTNIEDVNLAKTFTKSTIVKYDTVKEVLNAVVTNKADAMFGNGAVLYLANELGLPSLKNAVYLDSSLDLVFGIRKDWPEAVSIINKAIKHIGQQKLLELRQKWFFSGYKSKEDRKIFLNSAEKEYLKKHPIMTVHNEKNWPPYNFNVDGKPQGYSIDYMNLIASKLAIQIKYISGKNWDDYIQMIKDEKLDVMLNIRETKDRKKFINFTTNYIEATKSIFTNNKNIKTLYDLSGKTVAVPKGFFIHKFLEKNYPNIKLNVQKDSYNAILETLNGNTDAIIGDFAVTTFLLQSKGLSFKYSTIVKDERLTSKMNIGTSFNQSILRDILQKAMNTVSDKSIDKLKNKWLRHTQLETKTIPLTKYERKYLLDKKVIKMCNNPSWEPIEFTKDGNLKNMQGISIDTLVLLEEKLNIKFENVPTKSWAQSQEFLKNKKCDILPAAIQTDERLKYANFTKPYLTLPLAIFTTKDKNIISGLDQIIDMPWSRVKGSGLISKIQKKYPASHVIETKTVEESFRLVNNGISYFTIATVPVASNAIIKYQLNDLHIAGYTNMSYDISIAVRDDDKMLLTILEQGLADISKDASKQIFKKWVNNSITESVIDYTMIWQILFITLLIILGGIYWTRKLAKDVIKEKESAEDFEYLFNHTIETIGLFQNNICINFNGAGCELFGFKTKEDAIGKSPLDFIAPDSRELAKRNIQREYEVPYEMNAIKQDGTIFPILLRGLHKEIQGINTRIVTLIDLTKLKEKEIALELEKQIAQEATKAKSEFLANMS
ncbi:MAG: transporter substrate-binding domain-containing protein, partial [Arcobacteraceae bacterium]|nr:transporter substrate-binding domain-containing protein [Arcobacteraceae bacterium]